MAKLTVLYPPCAADPLDPGTVLDHRIAGETIAAGKCVHEHATTGRATVSDATSAGKHTPIGMSLQGSKSTLQSVPIIRRGLVAGFDLTGLNYGVLIYLDTTGDPADTANGTTTVPIGRVTATTRPDSAGVPEKLLEVFFNPIVAY